jgi:hypothetical protein
MLSSRPFDDVFVSRVSQTREHNRCVKGSMISSRLIDHVFVSRARDTNTSSNKREESMLPFTLRLLSLA